MHAHGSDRVRSAGDKIVLHSRIPKGWTPRTPKSATHSEFPGTAVLWEDAYYEVISAEGLPAGGVRYVLAPWADHHAIRVAERYDAESEAQRLADFELVTRQRKHSKAAHLAGVLLGHLPSQVQNHLANELGVRPTRMTLLSIVLSLTIVGTCIWLYVDSLIEQTPSPVSDLMWIFAAYLMLDSAVRFLVAMSQDRAMGSIPGFLIYLVVWLVAPNRGKLVSPFAENKGEKVFMIPPPEDVALRDLYLMRAPLLTLLTPAEQIRLAQRFGFDYREHAYGLTWSILVCAALGIGTSVATLSRGATVSALTSLLLAAFIVLEQIIRLLAFRRGPAGSIFAIFVRPFARDLLN
jgi:phage shock protein PspC (stress-responsive transcriptional regulator)